MRSVRVGPRSGQEVLRYLRRASGLVLLLLAWIIASHSSSHANLAIPAPLDVLRQMGDDLRSHAFWSNGAVTLLRGALGVAIGSAIGIALGFLIARIRLVRAALEPVLSALYPVPRVIMFPVFVVAIGIGTKSQVAIVAVECVFPLALTTASGIANIDWNLLRSATNAEPGRIRMAGLLLHGALPSILAGFRIVIPITITIVIAVQMLGGSSDGIGYLILVSASELNPTGVFSLAILCGAFGYGLYGGTIWLTGKVVFWEGEVRA